MTYYIGIDPDLHHTGIAAIDTKTNTFCLLTALTESKLSGEEANIAMAASLRNQLSFLKLMGHGRPYCIIESQRIRPGTAIKPQHIVMLAQAAGAAVGVVRTLYAGMDVALVQPQDWKGSAPKAVHHPIIREHFGLKEGQLGTHESHLLDAIGLAAWGWLRDSLPRASQSTKRGQIPGSVLSKQRLARLPRLNLANAAMLG